MNWTILIPLLLVWYWLYRLEKRINNMDEDRGLGVSYSFSVNAQEAICRHPKFLRDSKVKSAILGKEYGKWTKKEQESWGKYSRKNLGEKGWVRITYLTSENGFLINHHDKTYFVFREAGTKNLVSERIIGDELAVDGHRGLTFELDLRFEKDFDGKYRDFMVCYLEENEGWGKEKKAQVLFKFPYNSIDLDENYYKKLGFEVKWDDGDFIGKDSLGDFSGIPASTTYTQNKAKILVIH